MVMLRAPWWRASCKRNSKRGTIPFGEQMEPASESNRKPPTYKDDACQLSYTGERWRQGLDSNRRPSGYEPDVLTAEPFWHDRCPLRRHIGERERLPCSGSLVVRRWLKGPPVKRAPVGNSEEAPFAALTTVAAFSASGLSYF